MKKRIIYKGFRRPLFWLLYRGVKKCKGEIGMAFRHEFTSSCEYDFRDEQQFDWNKLWGISTNVNIHEESYRFVWRYNPATDNFEITSYCYIKGKKIISKDFVKVKANKSLYTTLDYKDGLITLKANGKKLVEFGGVHEFEYYYICGLYFGGTNKAPHKMRINLFKFRNNVK